MAKNIILILLVISMLFPVSANEAYSMNTKLMGKASMVLILAAMAVLTEYLHRRDEAAADNPKIEANETVRNPNGHLKFHMIRNPRNAIQNGYHNTPLFDIHACRSEPDLRL